MEMKCQGLIELKAKTSCLIKILLFGINKTIQKLMESSINNLLHLHLSPAGCKGAGSRKPSNLSVTDDGSPGFSRQLGFDRVPANISPLPVRRVASKRVSAARVKTARSFDTDCKGQKLVQTQDQTVLFVSPIIL